MLYEVITKDKRLPVQKDIQSDQVKTDLVFQLAIGCEDLLVVVEAVV